ncbi:MAG: hypothetical protein DI538_27460 [Azospira oryzae]|nr:MAG: hypothetical protein DI538_27460 [Azospira oryzae]
MSRSTKHNNPGSITSFLRAILYENKPDRLVEQARTMSERNKLKKMLIDYAVSFDHLSEINQDILQLWMNMVYEKRLSLDRLNEICAARRFRDFQGR